MGLEFTSIGDRYEAFHESYPNKFIVCILPKAEGCYKPHIISLVDTVEEAFRKMKVIVDNNKGFLSSFFQPESWNHGTERNESSNRN